VIALTVSKCAICATSSGDDDDHRLPRRVAPRSFVEGQNLTIVPGRFQVRNEQIADLVPPLVKAAHRRDHERRRCHHARPPEGDLGNSDYGRAKDRSF
jgi:hypothetical protein